MIQAASGSKYSDFLQERLFRPLGMRGTHVSQADMDERRNIAIPYAKLSNGVYVRLNSEYPSKDHGPTLATIGLRSCVSDLLTWSAAVMDAHDREVRTDSSPLPEPSNNPLKQMNAIWDTYWTRPVEDSFPNETAYCMGWYRTTMPTGALGLYSYGHRTRWDSDSTYLKYHHRTRLEI